MRVAVVDALAVVGVGLVTIGSGLIYLPAAFVTCGTLLIVGAVVLSYAEQTEEPEQ